MGTPNNKDVQTTQMQRRAAEEVLKQQLTGRNINQKVALKNAGYSDAVAHNPSRVTKSKGYRQYLDKFNLNEETVAGLISEDIKTLGAGDRFNYVKLLAQMLGMLEAKVDMNITHSEEGIDIIKSILANESESQDREPEQVV